jgi:hypothetical protein
MLGPECAEGDLEIDLESAAPQNRCDVVSEVVAAPGVGASRVSTEDRAWPDVRVLLDALLQGAEALGDRKHHPGAVRSLLDEIPLLGGVVHQVKYQRLRRLDDGSACGRAVQQHDFFKVFHFTDITPAATQSDFWMGQRLSPGVLALRGALPASPSRSRC